VQSLKKLWDRTIGELLVIAARGLIRAYQLTLSPMLGNVCRYYPTCSHYGSEAIATHRFSKGLLLTAMRIARCHPWAQGGWDPVPPVGAWRNPGDSTLIESSTTTGARQPQR
jgi:putative membrane protein insertion efficiency factor